MEVENASLHPDESTPENQPPSGGPEDKWMAAFDKVFADLKANHPADEWTLQLAGNEPQEEAVVEAGHLLLVKPINAEPVIACELRASDETNEGGDEPPKIPAEELVTLELKPSDETPDSEGVAADEPPNHSFLLVKKISTEELIVAELKPSDETDGTPDNEGVAAETVEMSHCPPLVEPPPEHSLLLVKPMPEEELIEATLESLGVTNQTGDDEGVVAETIELSHCPPPSGEEEKVDDDGADRSDAAQLANEPVVQLETVGNSQPEEPTVTDDINSTETIPADEEPQPIINCLPADETQEQPAVAEGVVECTTVSDQAAAPLESSPDAQPENGEDVAQESEKLTGDAEQLTAAVEAQIIPDQGQDPAEGDQPLGLGAINHDGSPAVAEQQSTPTATSPNSVAQGSTANASPVKKPRPGAPAGKKRPSSPPHSGNEDANNRKPEWMRRPLVRKGSVGRFIGRMRETMQSKRFGPDRLPVVPPPEPEPPKRPPRRKTLANLDLNRESVTASRETSQVDSASPHPPSPPPPTPRSPSGVDRNSVENRSVSNKSATLRSTTSERKRRNSVGRLAETAASRIRRALSIKNLHSADGSQPATAAEATPLLQQEPAVEKQTTPPPVQQPPPSPSPDKSIKKDFVQLMHRMDPRHVLDRILTPKSPAPAEEAKTKPSLPERPPPPATAAPVAKTPRVKPIVKNGKVQFECQKCQHQWSSVKGTARFEIQINQVGDGARQGQILVRLYGQRCKNCPAEEFEQADWSSESIEKVLTALRVDLGRRFYPDDQIAWDKPKAHQRKLCQACVQGVCHQKSSR